MPPLPTQSGAAVAQSCYRARLYTTKTPLREMEIKARQGLGGWIFSPFCSTWCLAGLELLEQHRTLGSPRPTRATPQPSPGESMLQLFVHSTPAEKSPFSSPFSQAGRSFAPWFFFL